MQDLVLSAVNQQAQGYDDSFQILHRSNSSLTIEWTVSPMKDLLSLVLSSQGGSASDEGARGLLVRVANDRILSEQSFVKIFKVEYYQMGLTSFLSRWQTASGFGGMSDEAIADLFGAVPKSMDLSTKKTPLSIADQQNDTDSGSHVRNKIHPSDRFLMKRNEKPNITTQTRFTITQLNPDRYYKIRITPGFVQFKHAAYNRNRDDFDGSDCIIMWGDPVECRTPGKTLSNQEEEARLASVDSRRSRLNASLQLYWKRKNGEHENYTSKVDNRSQPQIGAFRSSPLSPAKMNTHTV